MADDRRMTTDRFFGGVEGRLENLRSMLEYVDTAEPTESKLKEWLEANTGADSDSTMEMYLGFQKSIELLAVQGDHYATTARGSEFAATGDPELVAQALLENVKGFETILQAIESGYRTREEIQAQLRDQYPGYSLPLSIVGRHLEWLRVIGAIDRHDEQFLLGPLGQHLVDEFEAQRWINFRMSEGDSQSNRGETGDRELQRLREVAESAATEQAPRSTTERSVTEYDRSGEVREYVMARADGHCEGCGEPAPFRNTAGEPYLHSHHIHELADGGPDSPDTVIALCPNCHYRVHHSEDGDAYNRELEHRLVVIEDDAMWDDRV